MIEQQNVCPEETIILDLAKKIHQNKSNKKCFETVENTYNSIQIALMQEEISKILLKPNLNGSEEDLLFLKDEIGKYFKKKGYNTRPNEEIVSLMKELEEKKNKKGNKKIKKTNKDPKQKKAKDKQSKEVEDDEITEDDDDLPNDERPIIIHENTPKRRIEYDANLSMTKKRMLISQDEITMRQKIIPKGWYKIEKEQVYPRTLITFINNSSEDEIQAIIEFLEDLPNDQGTLKTAKIKGNAIEISCPDKDNLNKIINNVMKNFKNVEAKLPQLFNPKVRIQNVHKPIEVTKEQFIESIRRKNNWPKEDEILITHWSNQNYQDRFSITIQVTPRIRGMIEDNFGQINYKLQGYKASDSFAIIICKKCFIFGHYTEDCNQQKRCPFCAKCHNGQCPYEGDKLNWYCRECDKKGHSVMSRKCPAYIRILNILFQSINYNYDYIMATNSEYD